MRTRLAMPPLLTPDSPRFISVEVDDRYHFALKRGKLLDGDSITEFLAALLATCLTDPTFVAIDLQKIDWKSRTGFHE
jgi:hypothetical protein